VYAFVSVSLFFFAVLDSDTNPLNQSYALIPDSQHLCSVSMNPIVAGLIQAFVHSVVRSVHPSFVLTDCCGLWQRENYQKNFTFHQSFQANKF
jgi:hypothetical protein